MYCRFFLVFFVSGRFHFQITVPKIFRGLRNFVDANVGIVPHNIHTQFPINYTVISYLPLNMFLETHL